MKTKLLACCIGVLSISAVANTNNMYVQGDVLYGVTHTQTTNRILSRSVRLPDVERDNNELSYRIAMGQNFGDWRADLFVLRGVPTKSALVAYSATDERLAERSYYAFGVSGYYDFKVATMPTLMPYVGASVMSVNYTLEDSDKADAMAYELKAGLKYQLNPNLAIDAGVNHYQTGKVTYGTKDTFINKYSHIKPQLGVRYYY